jgi:NarL family two-component system response regulator LiaR
MHMSETKIIKVMLVDDHPIVRDGLKALLLTNKDMEYVGEAGSGKETLIFCERTVPDVILMDMAMPGMDGLETTRAVLDQHPEVEILILTSFPDENLVQRTLAAGAKGYLLKNVSSATLANAIRSAYAGQLSFSPEVTHALVEADSHPQRVGDNLSAREREVLAMVVQGLSNDEIASRLVISPFTVKNHVSACISKLGAANRTQAATIAVEYRLVP